MKHTLLLFLFFLPMDAFSFGHIVFTKNTYDFGSIQKTEKLTHRFIFTNKGDAPVRIKNVQTSCGCQSVSFNPEQTYASDEQGFLDVDIDTSSFVGPKVFSVVVTSDEPFYPYKILSMKADVSLTQKETELSLQKDPIYFEPSYVELGALGVHQVIERKIFLKSEESFNIQKTNISLTLNGKPIEQTDEFISYTLSKEDAASSKNKVIKLRIKNPSKEAGSLHGRVSLATNKENFKNLSLEFYAFLQGDDRLN